MSLSNRKKNEERLTSIRFHSPSIQLTNGPEPEPIDGQFILKRLRYVALVFAQNYNGVY
jgi:hypothetical protein